ncbi:YSIRK-type signal peptide-containing protein [Lactobacillus helveticus]|uniref:YSIRK-type signal peptide-containing protein n=1 Tax=Lactobacillus helveticus TaxID=1587 RepID=UPI001C636EC0|nr:YSIRK-type signal peptide-containing protein [Lactobacillus helveticus]
MLSKNNYKEKLQKMKPKKDRFSIRKFTVGAASVLIGFTFMGAVNSQEVKADTKPVSPEAKSSSK